MVKLVKLVELVELVELLELVELVAREFGTSVTGDTHNTQESTSNL